MKKYLMTGMAAIAFCAAFTSCSKGEDIYDPDFKQKEVTLSYEQAFINTFGQPAADQDWGFGTSTRAFTRAGQAEVIKPDMTNFPGFTEEARQSHSPQGYKDVIAPVTDLERQYVQAWFEAEENAGLTEQGWDIHNFFVQDVSNNGGTKAGYHHENGVTTAQTYDNCYMDHLQIGATRNWINDTDHTLDFNATKGFNDWNVVYYKNSSALQFGYHQSYASAYEWYFKCAAIEVPGYCFEDNKARVGYYVGMSYYAKANRGTDVYGEKWDELGVDRLQWGDDWIIKVVPGEGEVIPSTIRVIGEDLSANTPSDFDFNDIVVDVTLTSTGADCVLKAAGGTLPLIIGIKNPDDTKDAVDYPNNEVHKLFGVTVDTMVNTNAENTPDPKDPSKMLKGASRPDVSFSITGNWSTVKDVPIYVKKNGHWMELTAERGVPASKIGVDDTFVWCLEKVNISGQYPRFTNWVTKNLDNQSKWY